jgi:hypothetical protein
MAHITSIGAGIYSALCVYDTEISTLASADTLAECVSLFATAGDVIQIGNVREFPAIGTPANIVNVPVYGQSTSSQVQGQADAPNLEITINYVPSLWESSTTLGAMVGSGKLWAFQFSLLNAKPAGYNTTAGMAGLGSVANSNFYFVGKIEALLVTPQLTDANQATLTLSTQSAFFGPATVASA